jgi:acyl-CoA thioesterase YciA
MDMPAASAPLNTETEPRGDLCIRTLAMPADTNANGDIFGGWLLSQMDLGGGIFASKVAKSRTVTVAIEAMNFRKAVYVGDLVSVHANLVRIGRTSVTVHLEAWVLRRREMLSIPVTDGNFTYVSIDDQGHPQAIARISLVMAGLDPAIHVLASELKRRLDVSAMTGWGEGLRSIDGP